MLAVVIGDDQSREGVREEGGEGGEAMQPPHGVGRGGAGAGGVGAGGEGVLVRRHAEAREEEAIAELAREFFM